LLEITTAKSQLDRKELFPTPDDWLLFDIVNERLITAKRASNEVAGAGVYLVVSSAAAAENRLYEIAGKYIPEEVMSRAKAKEGVFASFWEKVLGRRDSREKEIAVPATIARESEKAARGGWVVTGDICRGKGYRACCFH
jgi:hypothetical protein